MVATSIPGSFSTRPNTTKVDQNRPKSIKIDQNRSNSIKNDQTHRWGFDPRGESVQWTLQSKNSAGSLRPFIVGVCIPKESVTTLRLGNLRRTEAVASFVYLMSRHEAKLGEASYHIPAIIFFTLLGLLGLGQWLGVLPDNTPATQGVRSFKFAPCSFKFAPWDIC